MRGRRRGPAFLWVEGLRGPAKGENGTMFTERGLRMRTVFLAGGIASGKSTVAAELERLGAMRIDLDEVSRLVLAPGEPCLAEACAVFGDDLVDAETGELNRALLAERAFSSPEAAARLEALELPHITRELRRRLAEVPSETGVVVVEVPLLDRAEALIPLVDEVMVVTCPLELRRERAHARGMDPADFDARAALQPSDDYLRSHADTLIPNAEDERSLLEAVDAWWRERETGARAGEDAR